MRGSDESIDEPLAHSPVPPIPAQTYRSHVSAVMKRAETNAQNAAQYHSGCRDEFINTVKSAGLFHDLGKLDLINQEVLRRAGGGRLPLPHADAGVAELLKLRRNEAAVLVAAHHAGLFSREEEQKKREIPFRDISERLLNGSPTIVANHVDDRLNDYVRDHSGKACLPALELVANTELASCGFSRRVALSCLVDADHGDTARHRGNEVPTPDIPTRWPERIAALDAYVQSLPASGVRDKLRAAMYEDCCRCGTDVSIRSCDAPVGSGKTTAVMANLLRAAEVRRLRHIIVVLPYTNIIKQSVKTYRQALTLPGEDPLEVVAEHHHQADFEHIDLRQLATLWKAPIIVTTAVQFFETLGSNNPARLRKLHELPGSAVFVDEMHMALPSPLWPQVWRWLNAWTSDWGGYLVFGSGSLPRFWELREFVDPPVVVPDLVTDALRAQLAKAEQVRIRFKTIDPPLSPDELVSFVLGKPGPRLLIMNTVQSAAYIADILQTMGVDVLHLSTALAPADREKIVEKIEQRLKNTTHNDWILVATSCVEAGMNFSFRSGFRERSSAASAIQVGGRVCRGAEYSDAVVWDFQAEGGLLTQNPSLELPRRVLKRLFQNDDMNNLAAGELAKTAMRQELTQKGKDMAAALRQAEEDMNYPRVGELCRVINANTCLVVVRKSVADRIKYGQPVSSRELLRHSVQMWTHKIATRELPLTLIRGSADSSDALYSWDADYDPEFLGYMSGALPLLAALQDGAFIV